MMFLVMKIFVYLVLAGCAGIGAGWLLRDLQARQIEERAQRSVHDAKSKVPQLESLLRGRDEQIVKLKAEIKERRQELQQAQHAVEQAQRDLRDKERELARWKNDQDTEHSVLDGADDSATDALIAGLSREITELKQALDEARAAPAPLAPGVDDTAGPDAALTQRLAQADQSAANAIEERDRYKALVEDLERERDLQNSSMQILHRQLELERSRRLAG